MKRNEGEMRKTETTDMGAEKPCFPDTSEGQRWAFLIGDKIRNGAKQSRDNLDHAK